MGVGFFTLKTYSLNELFCKVLLRVTVSFSGIRNAIIHSDALISTLYLKVLNDDAFILVCGNFFVQKSKCSSLNLLYFLLIFVTDPKKSSQQCAVAATFPSCRRAQYPAVCTKLGSCPKQNHLFTCCPQRRTCEERAAG